MFSDTYSTDNGDVFTFGNPPIAIDVMVKSKSEINHELRIMDVT
jgi:hypothetical protein